MKNLWIIVKKYYEFITYTLLTILLLCACFSHALMWVTAGYIALLVLVFRDETKLIGLMMFLICFDMLAKYQKFFEISSGEIIVGFLILSIAVLYLIRVIKHEQKLNWKTLIPIWLFLIYAALPFHECTWQSFFTKMFFFILLYVVFEERQRIDFRHIVRCFVFGLVVSCCLVLLRNFSPLLIAQVRTYTYSSGERFHGLMTHPNVLARFLILTICATLILKYKNKISLTEFLLEFVPLFVFGYLTISRMFVITLAVGMGIFAVFYVVKHKVHALPLFGIVLAIMCVVGGIFFNTTKIYFDRIIVNPAVVEINTQLTPTSLDELFAGQSEAWIQDVFAGKVRFDPGRSGLREMYLSDWLSSPKTIWFGRGIGRPKIGKMYAHNLLIEELWRNGLIGYLLYALMILGTINWKKIKQIHRWLPALMILVPYLLTTLIEPCINDCLQLTLVIAAFGCLEQLFETEV